MWNKDHLAIALAILVVLLLCCCGGLYAKEHFDQQTAVTQSRGYDEVWGSNSPRDPAQYKGSWGPWLSATGTRSIINNSLNQKLGEVTELPRDYPPS